MTFKDEAKWFSFEMSFWFWFSLRLMLVVMLVLISMLTFRTSLHLFVWTTFKPWPVWVADNNGGPPLETSNIISRLGSESTFYTFADLFVWHFVSTLCLCLRLVKSRLQWSRSAVYPVCTFWYFIPHSKFDIFIHHSVHSIAQQCWTMLNHVHQDHF